MSPPIDFTYRFRNVMAAARDEAIALGSRKIEPGHLLLAVLAEDKGAANAVLAGIGVDTSRLRENVRAALSPAVTGTMDEIFFHSENAKRVLELSMGASRDLGHDHIGTEHLLLALLRVSDTIAARELEQCGVTFERAQHEIAELLANPDSENDETSGSTTATDEFFRLREGEEGRPQL